MSEEIKEDIVLELKTNFEAELKNSVAQYANFQKRAGDISRNLESNVNTMFRGVSNNISSMLQNTQKTVASSIGLTRRAMRETQNESNKLSKSYENLVNKIIQTKKKAGEIAGSTIFTDDVKQQELEILSSKSRAEVEKAANEMFAQLSNLANNSSQTILKSTKDSLTAVKELAKGTKQTLVELQVAINNSGKADDVTSAKGKIDEIEGQLKKAKDIVKEQAKQVIQAEKEMNTARVSLMEQTDAKLYAIQEKQFQRTVENVTKTQKAFNDTERAVANLEQTISQGKERIAKGAEGTKEKIRLQIDLSDPEKMFKALMDNFKKSVSLASGGMSKEFENSVAAGQRLGSVMQGNRKALEKMLADAQALHKTGLVDSSKEIEAIQSILGKMDEFKSEFKEIQKTAKFFDLAKFEDEFKRVEASIDSLSIKISQTMVKPPQLDAKSNINDLQQAKDKLNVIDQEEKKFANERAKIIKTITSLEKEAEKIRLEITKQTNKEVIESLNQVQVELQNKANRFKTLLQEAITPDTSKLKSDIKSTADRMNVDIQRSFKGLKLEPIKAAEEIKAKYKALRDDFNKLSNTRFIKKEAVSGFEASVKKIRDSVKEYNREILVLKENIEKLQKLQKMGLAPESASRQLEEQRKRLAEMKSNLNELNNLENKATLKAEAVAKQASKGMFRHGLEMVRNFRWQVAGFIYLITKAVNAFKNTFLKVIRDIQEFRTSALAIAASISYSLLGNMSENFNQAYLYSRNLMQKLEMEAAKTILTLEDMTMLTKTFVQAGIIPKTDEDVRKISTIGTAIKILTEGMANAGVQMRQELYALIQGRQRAVDQVATMFSMIGINIQEIMEKGRKEGKTMIDVLSEALKPFEEVNKAMAHDYSVQEEALEKIWAKIKRIGGDNTYKEISATLEKINDSLAKMEDGQLALTEAGKDLAVTIAVIMESTRLTVKSVSYIASALLSAKGAASLLLTVFKFIARSVAFVSITIDFIDTAVRATTGKIAQLIKATNALLTQGPKAAYKSWQESSKAIDKTWDDFGRRAGDFAMDVERSIKSIEDITKAGKDGIVALGDSFKLPNRNVVDELSKIGKKVQEAKKAALSGIERINEEYSQDVEKYKQLKGDIIENIKAIKSALSKSDDTTKNKEFNEMLKGHMKALNDIAQYEMYLLKERGRKTSEYYEKERQKIISLKAEFENLMESMNEAPTSRMEVIDKKYRKEEITLKKFIEKNKNEFQKLIDANKADFAELGIKTSEGLQKALWNAFEQGKENSIKNTTQQIQEEFDAMMESLNSHNVLNPLERINNEMDKLLIAMKKNNDVMADPIKVERYKQAVEQARKERTELEKIKILNDIINAQMAAKNAYADYLVNSIRPFDKQRAELIKLQAQYEVAADAIKKSILEIYAAWTVMGEWKENAPVEQVQALYRQLGILEDALNYHKTRVQEPFWNDLKDMSQGWFDSFADVLNEAAFNMSSFSESFKTMITDIARSVSRQWIKRNITDNIMNMLPSFTGGNKEGDESSGEAVARKTFTESMKSGWSSVTDMFKSGFGRFVEISKLGFNVLQEGLSLLFNSLKGLFGSSGGAMQYNFGTKDTSWIGDVAKGVVGIFSGGGGSSGGDWSGDVVGGGGVASGGAYGLGGDLIAMANGGVIKEPIIGKGLRSGDSYQFGEGGIQEAVIPMSDMKKMGGSSNMLSINVPVSVSGGMDSKIIAKLKNELEKTVEATTMRVIRGSV